MRREAGLDHCILPHYSSQRQDAFSVFCKKHNGIFLPEIEMSLYRLNKRFLLHYTKLCREEKEKPLPSLPK
jgi:hypothetical protein